MVIKIMIMSDTVREVDMMTRRPRKKTAIIRKYGGPFVIISILMSSGE